MEKEFVTLKITGDAMMPNTSMIESAIRALRQAGHIVTAADSIPGLFHIDGGPELTTNQLIGLAAKAPSGLFIPG